MASITSFDAISPYVTVAAADIYFHATLSKSANWDKLTDAQKLAALKEATLDIDQLYFIGTKVNLNQDREWPRFLDTGSFSDTVMAEDIPNQVGFSCCEQAYYIGMNFRKGYDPNERFDHQMQGLSSISRAGASENFNLESARRHRLCQPALELLRSFIAKTMNLEDDSNYNIFGSLT